jgi:dTDP-4-amino-4,6-dideoxygalactose transaminase
MASAHKVRYIDYPKAFRNQEAEIMDTIHTVLANGDLMLRQQLRDFESNLAAFVGTKHAIGLSNCTDALHLMMRAAGIGPGDEVITVSHTFIATVAAIHHVGATPILVDIADDHNMDIERIQAAVTPRTKAIVPVQLNGRMCNMDALMDIAKHYNLLILEDSAQALGASYKGKRGGAWGLAGCFSFYPAKLLGAFGDAGALVTNDDDYAQKVRQLRDHGRTADNDIAFFGFNHRLDNLHAALLDLKLKSLPEWLDRRRQIAALYDEGLKDLPQLRLPVPPATDGLYHDVYQNYEIEAENRDGLVAFLRENGIEVMITWGGKAVHQFKNLNLAHFSLPRTEELFRKVLMIPMYPELEDDHAQIVVETIRRFYRA